MKFLGVILVVTGLLISIWGYGMYANFECHCPNQISGHSFNCHCEENLQQTMGHIVTYFGFGITGSGIILFVLGWRRQKFLTGVGK